jgi:hypothetical protein
VDLVDSLPETTNGICNYTRDKGVLVFPAQSMLYTCNDSGCIIKTLDWGIGSYDFSARTRYNISL